MFRASLGPSSGGRTAFHCLWFLSVLLPDNTLCTVHTSSHPTLQHHNSYKRTETIGSETQSDLLTMGVKTPETC
jgi:hypothetical protein